MIPSMKGFSKHFKYTKSVNPLNNLHWSPERLNNMPRVSQVVNSSPGFKSRVHGFRAWPFNHLMTLALNSFSCGGPETKLYIYMYLSIIRRIQFFFFSTWGEVNPWILFLTLLLACWFPGRMFLLDQPPRVPFIK